MEDSVLRFTLKIVTMDTFACVRRTMSEQPAKVQGGLARLIPKHTYNYAAPFHGPRHRPHNSFHVAHIGLALSANIRMTRVQISA